VTSYDESLPIFRAATDSGVPWRFAHGLVERILHAGHLVAVAKEEPGLSGHVNARTLRYLFEPVVPASSHSQGEPS